MSVIYTLFGITITTHTCTLIIIGQGNYRLTLDCVPHANVPGLKHNTLSVVCIEFPW